ncbi:sirohydrochlorin chelatase [Paenibacillus jilunlii]|nr:sirohydrochlorin chelatase [Paenibacillus jilunlii]
MGSGISANDPQVERVLHCEHTHAHNHERAQGITTVLLVGHGSRVEEGNEELRNFTRALAARKPELAVETCFIELSAPSISEGIDKCVLGGAGTVYVVPIILFAAGHSKLDIPLALDQAKLKYPGVEFVYGRPLGVQERAVEILLDRIAGAVPQPVQIPDQPELPGDPLEKTPLVEHGSSAQLNTGGLETAAALSVGGTASADRNEPYSKVSDEDTIVLVMGRGGSDPDANSDFYKLTRLLWERTPYKSVEACFIAITKPSLPAGLERCLALGARKIIVLPYLLFTGVLMKQFNETVNRFAAAHPEIEVEAGTYLGSHPLLSDMLLERIEETLAGRTAANCDNCKYREEASAHHHHHHHDHHHHDDHHHHHNHHSHGEEGHGHGCHGGEGHGHCGHQGGNHGHGHGYGQGHESEHEHVDGHHAGHGKGHGHGHGEKHECGHGEEHGCEHGHQVGHQERGQQAAYDGHKSGRNSQPASADAEGRVPQQPGASYSEVAVHPANAPKEH